MSAAEREAERRYVMEHGAGYSYPREAVVTMKRGAFEAGATWQAERDAVRIAELEAEIEDLREARGIVTALQETSTATGQAVTEVARMLIDFWALDLDGRAEKAEARVAELEAEIEGIKRRDAEVGEDEGWWVGGAWGDYGEAVVPLRILSYVIDGKLDEKVTSIDPGFALTYAEQTARAEVAEAKLAEVRAVFTDTSLSSVAMIERLGLLVFDGDDET